MMSLPPHAPQSRRIWQAERSLSAAITSAAAGISPIARCVDPCRAPATGYGAGVAIVVMAEGVASSPNFRLSGHAG